MRIAIVGAGPAGLTSARQALEAGHDVTVFERHGTVGGIWNPGSHGAYPSVRMQSSRMSFPFAAYPPGAVSAFPTLAEVHAYLLAYAEDSRLTGKIHFSCEVDRIAKEGREWHVYHRDGTTRADAVMIATGELWTPILPRTPERPTCTILTAKDYRTPEAFAGQRVLVVGGGVSGADIASEVSRHAAGVIWSVRKKALFLPRAWDGVYNDDLFSYAVRIAVGELRHDEYLDLLRRIMPGYMAMYEQSGILPTEGFNNAAHINDDIVPLVHAGAVTMAPAFDRFQPDGRVVFADGSEATFDTVILCMGYAMAKYGFVEGFRHERLFEHFIYADDPTLAVINTPVDTDAYGTACPYFEAIAGWALDVITGRAALPEAAELDSWCRAHMGNLRDKRFYDCWLETIRLRLRSGTLPDPHTEFDRYWNVVASRVAPAHLDRDLDLTPAAFDHLFDVDDLKARILASLPIAVRDRALSEGRISEREHRAAASMAPSRKITPDLPYRMR